ncbi:hypothetical protein L226DRAFT_532282 [Lentinus tigrinus ALCF2SS1-7]|uniref:Protein kinase domain-containing protein n=1 Tax=Lentinus tigrinus ALCF2SS1-6 TaxID=1328759 RepID=A0A5C2SHX8_9APHY|nr:hypothetical protein L227DRAFT_573263 [Lentinus tigrinus ALCF2SS1-6]RPD77497.1 hypothetical protein L226DRAFT_532282 [Lentinus tigrinus ALCF2SS1-7]
MADIPPGMFSAGQRISLIASERTFTFTIDRPFMPFTKSVVLLVRSQELGPDPVVLKMYDPRFLDERFPLPVPTALNPHRHWSLAAERAAAALPPGTYKDEDQLYAELPDDPQAHAERTALWEAYFRYLSTRCFKDEKMAYENLRVLQGTAIPRLLLTGVIIPPDERAIQPPAIVLEYVPDAVSLRDVSIEAVDADLWTTLVRVVDSFTTYDVCHNDINHNNILFTPREHPKRVVVIDFGCAAVREDEDDETWEEIKFQTGDGRRLQWVLQRKGVTIADKDSSVA